MSQEVFGLSTGLIALLDDVVGLTKVAAASLDDVAGQAGRAGAKAAGVVVDDAAVTPRYVVGFTAERELPIIGRIALGSLKNKLLYLLPVALVLSVWAPWAITPLLMLGGGFLCYEGAEKVYEALFGGHGDEHAAADAEVTATARQLEEEKVAGAIKTDLILSAEIMAITLSTVAAETSSFWGQALILALVGAGITVAVYGAVALIVKADDIGLSLAQNPAPASSFLGLRSWRGRTPRGVDRVLQPWTKALGRGLVHGMPVFLRLLALIGTMAMLWVGGGIILHGLEAFGFSGAPHAVHAVASSAGHALPDLSAVIEWLVGAAGAGMIGLLIGVFLVLVLHHGLFPLLKGSPARKG